MKNGMQRRGIEWVGIDEHQWVQSYAAYQALNEFEKSLWASRWRWIARFFKADQHSPGAIEPCSGGEVPIADIRGFTDVNRKMGGRIPLLRRKHAALWVREYLRDDFTQTVHPKAFVEGKGWFLEYSPLVFIRFEVARAKGYCSFPVRDITNLRVQDQINFPALTGSDGFDSWRGTCEAMEKSDRKVASACTGSCS